MIVVFGSLNIDLVTRVPALPRPGETVLAESYATLCGGKGANQAVAAARASGGLRPVRMFGAVGDDEFGALCRANLQREGVDVSGIATVVEGTGCAFIQVDDAGENVITVASGANRLPKGAQTRGAALGPADILVLQMEVPLQESVAAAIHARSIGARVLCNLAPVPAGLDADALRELLAVVDILIVNEHELAQAAACLEIEGGAPERVAAAMAARAGAAVVATLGADGALAALPGGGLVKAAAPPIQPVDTTGAGDTFVGVLAAMLAEGRPLNDALGLACKGAALACMALGAQSAMPVRAAILG